MSLRFFKEGTRASSSPLPSSETKVEIDAGESAEGNGIPELLEAVLVIVRLTALALRLASTVRTTALVLVLLVEILMLTGTMGTAFLVMAELMEDTETLLSTGVLVGVAFGRKLSVHDP